MNLSLLIQNEILGILEKRFEKNMKRHKNFQWNQVKERLLKYPKKMAVLNQMEITGGEPDVVEFDKKTSEFIFFDCSAESPKERRSLCYDHEALEKRKEHKPKNSAIEKAKEMGVEILTEEQYRQLQKLGTFDAKTSSWLKTPSDIRSLGGAISGEYRFGCVFVYANGAESYFGSRGFRAALKV